MATRVLVVWVLLIQIMWAGVFLFFHHHFAPRDIAPAKIHALEQKVNQLQRVVAKQDFNFLEYKDAVAFAGVKIQNDTRWTDSRRMVASLMADPNFKTPISLTFAKDDFEKGKKLFLANDYSRAAEVFTAFVNQHPENIHVAEASLFLSESYFYGDQLEESVKAINLLVTHFPETEYAGYALVRLGKIFEREERPEDAADVYHVVIEHFVNSNAARLAKLNLKELPL